MIHKTSIKVDKDDIEMLYKALYKYECGFNEVGHYNYLIKKLFEIKEKLGGKEK